MYPWSTPFRWYQWTSLSYQIRWYQWTWFQTHEGLTDLMQGTHYSIHVWVSLIRHWYHLMDQISHNVFLISRLLVIRSWKQVSLTRCMRYRVSVSVKYPLIPRLLQLLTVDVTSCHLMSVSCIHWYKTLHGVYEGLMCLKQLHWYPWHEGERIHQLNGVTPYTVHYLPWSPATNLRQ